MRHVTGCQNVVNIIIWHWIKDGRCCVISDKHYWVSTLKSLYLESVFWYFTCSTRNCPLLHRVQYRKPKLVTEKLYNRTYHRSMYVSAYLACINDDARWYKIITYLQIFAWCCQASSSCYTLRFAYLLFFSRLFSESPSSFVCSAFFKSNYQNWFCFFHLLSTTKYQLRPQKAAGKMLEQVYRTYSSSVKKPVHIFVNIACRNNCK